MHVNAWDSTFCHTAIWGNFNGYICYAQGSGVRLNMVNLAIFNDTVDTAFGFRACDGAIVRLSGCVKDPVTQSTVPDGGGDSYSAGSSTAGYVFTDPRDIYHADIELTIDGANTQDEYTATWFHDGLRVTSGITSPTIQVVKRDGTGDLIASTAMTLIGSTGSYKKDAVTTARTTAGEAVVVIVGATIDGAVRSYARVLSRDSA